VSYEHQEMADSLGNDFPFLHIYNWRSMLVKTASSSQKSKQFLCHGMAEAEKTSAIAVSCLKAPVINDKNDKGGLKWMFRTLSNSAGGFSEQE
jgi:hypothetical protein